MAIRPSTISRFRFRTAAISDEALLTAIPNLVAWCARSATLALQISFLLGRQLTFGQEPPTHRRSTTTVCCPDCAKCQARDFPPSPLPMITFLKFSTLILRPFHQE